MNSQRPFLTSAILLGALIAVVWTMPVFAAECENYEEYMRWVNLLPTSGDAVDVFVEGDLAYVCDSNRYSGGPTSYLRIYDITSQSLPVQVGSLEMPDGIRDVHVSGSMAVACIDLDSPSGALPVFMLIDISDPANLVVLSQPNWGDLEDVSLIGVPRQALIHGSSLYCLSIFGDSMILLSLNISNPSQPTLDVEFIESLDGTNIVKMVLVGDLLHVMDGQEYFMFGIDQSGQISGRHQFFTTWVYSDIAVVGHIAYLGVRDPEGSTNGGLRIVNTEHEDFIELGFYSTSVPPGVDVRLTMVDGLCYIGSEAGNIQMVDVSDPTAPSYFDDFPTHAGGNILNIQSDDTDIYLSTQSAAGAQTISVVSPAPMEAISVVNTPGDAQAVVLEFGRASYAYVADGLGGIQVINVSDPLNPQIVGSVQTPGSANDLELVGNKVYVADGTDGLQVVNVTNPLIPVIDGWVDTPGDAVDLAVKDDFAFVADVTGGLQVIDVGNPTNPSIVGSVTEITSARGVAVEDSLCYVAADDDGLIVCSVNHPDDPWIIDGVKGRGLGQAMDVDAVGNIAYVADADSGLFIIDATDPWNLDVRSSIGTTGTARDAVKAGIMAFVASGNGMNLIDIQDPDVPLVVGNITVPDAAKGVFIDNFYSYIAAGPAGLQICPSQCGFNELLQAGFTADFTQAFYPASIQFTNDSIGYGLTYDWDFGDGLGSSTEKHPNYTYNFPGIHTVKLIAFNATRSDSTTLDIEIQAEEPTITAVRDVPEDQGGWVYVDYFHSAYDDTPLGKRTEIYTIQRQDDGQWVTVATSGAYGEPYYSVLAPTQNDGADDWTTPFRVIGHMSEGNWASSVVEGYSLDNIAPAVPANLMWLGPDQLGWDPVGDEDFAYYRIYGSSTAEFEDGVLIEATIETSVAVDVSSYGWFFVTAVDDSDLESEPSTPGAVSGIPQATGTLRLSEAYPNPFNPTTTFHFDLPKAGPVRLAVYDVSGRMVRELLDGDFPAGRHFATWDGFDGKGRMVSSGGYFCRIEADGKTLVRRLMLIK